MNMKAEQLASEGYEHYQRAMAAFSARQAGEAKTQFIEAKSCYEQALGFAPDDPDINHLYAGICAHMGLARLGEKHFKLAIEFATNPGDKQRYQGGLHQLYATFGRPS